MLRSSCDRRPFGHSRHRPKSRGLLCPFLGGVGSPSNTMWLGPRPTSLPSATLIHPAVWPQQTWAKNWGGGCAPLRGSWVPSNTTSPGQRSTSLPSGILIHPTVSPQQTWAENWGGACPFLWGELGLHPTQCGLGRGLRPYQVAS